MKVLRNVSDGSARKFALKSSVGAGRAGDPLVVRQTNMSTLPTAFGRDEIYFGTERVRFAPAAGRAIAYVHAHHAPDIGAASVRRTLRRAAIPPVPAAPAPPEAELPWIVPWCALDSTKKSRAGSEGALLKIFQPPPPPPPPPITHWY
jgi:hypothetical protein